MPSLEMDKFQELRGDPGSAEWEHTNEKRRKSSKLDSTKSRMVRDAQSAIAKDIKAANRDMLRETDPAKRENLRIHKEALETLQRRMRQSNTVDGRKVYNSAVSRIEAFGLYVQSFKGRMLRDMAKNGPSLEGVRITGDITSNRMFQRLKAQYNEKEFDWMNEDEWIPGLEDLYNELDEAVRNYDSEQARRVIGKIHHMVDDYKARRGTVDLDSNDEDGQAY